jgi:hypothetical protein
MKGKNKQKSKVEPAVPSVCKSQKKQVMKLQKKNFENMGKQTKKGIIVRRCIGALNISLRKS